MPGMHGIHSDPHTRTHRHTRTTRSVSGVSRQALSSLRHCPSSQMKQTLKPVLPSEAPSRDKSLCASITVYWLNACKAIRHFSMRTEAKSITRALLIGSRHVKHMTPPPPPHTHTRTEVIHVKHTPFPLENGGKVDNKSSAKKMVQGMQNTCHSPQRIEAKSNNLLVNPPKAYAIFP